jgi:hypothetical protein
MKRDPNPSALLVKSLQGPKITPMKRHPLDIFFDDYYSG